MCLDEEKHSANFRPSHCHEVKNCTEKNMLMVPKLNLTNTLTHTAHSQTLEIYLPTTPQLHLFVPCSDRSLYS